MQPARKRGSWWCCTESSAKVSKVGANRTSEKNEGVLAGEVALDVVGGRAYTPAEKWADILVCLHRLRSSMAGKNARPRVKEDRRAVGPNQASCARRGCRGVC